MKARLLEDKRGTRFPGAHECKQPSMSPGNQIFVPPIALNDGAIIAVPKLSFSYECWDLNVSDHICVANTFPTEQSLQSHFFLQIFFIPFKRQDLNDLSRLALNSS